MPVRMMFVNEQAPLIEAFLAAVSVQEEICVVGAANGTDEALELSRKTHPDVALVDLGNHGGQGYEAVTRLRADTPELAIVGLSLADVNGGREAALQAGADELLAKTVALAEVLYTARRVALSRGARPLPVSECHVCEVCRRRPS